MTLWGYQVDLDVYVIPSIHVKGKRKKNSCSFIKCLKETKKLLIWTKRGLYVLLKYFLLFFSKEVDKNK